MNRLTGRIWPLSIALLAAATVPLLWAAEDETGPATTQPTTSPATTQPDGWFAAAKLSADRPVLGDTVAVAFVIPMREPITTKTFEALKRKTLRCQQGKAELVIIDMDTWGGEALAAMDIARLIKTELNDVYTVCYVRTRAISAGALIALACDEIIMTPVGKLGDCAPIMQMGKLEGVEREKGESPLRVEFIESAERNGYPTALAESMVTIGREVWLVRNKETRELRYVLRKDFAGKVSFAPGVTTAPASPGGQWELVRVVVTNKELLTMTPRQATDFGFASALVEPPREDELAGVLERFNVTGELIVLKDNWSERLVQFLSSAPVVTFLFFIALLCAYVEMHTPGFGVAGGVAIACFAVMFGSGYLVGLAAWWEIALFAIGLLLIAAEIFLIPGFGVAGIGGAVFCLVAAMAMLIPNAPDSWPIPQSDIDWGIFTTGLKALIVGFLMACAGAVILARYLPKLPVAGRLVLETPKPVTTGPVGDNAPINKVSVGAVGTVESPCRPVGQVRFAGVLVDAVAEGQFVQAGAKVKAVKIEGNRILITPLS